MDVWWYGAEPSMVRRRLEVFQVGCCCSRAPFQGSNCHRSHLLRDACPVLKLKEKRKAAVFGQCLTQPALFAVLIRNNNKTVINNNEAIKLSRVYESEKCLPCLTRKWFCFLAFEGPQLLTLRAEIREEQAHTADVHPVPLEGLG